MTESHADPAYCLYRTHDHLQEDELDATLVRYPGSQNVAGWTITRPIQVPERIEFRANFETLQRTDYPATDVHWPIMSRKMISVLESVGEFAHRTIPVTMVDVRSKQASNDHAVVQLLEYTTGFDWESSEYEADPDFEGEIRMATRAVLIEPEGGFPPLFRLDVQFSQLLVSRAAADALQRAGVRGVRFESPSRVGL